LTSVVLVGFVVVSLFCPSQPLQAATADGRQIAAAGQSGPIKIGFLNSLTRIGAIPGNEMLKGFKVYLDQGNNKIAGRDVDLVVEDDGSDATQAVAKLKKLAGENNVDAVAGIFSSAVAYAVAPIANQLHVPLVITLAGADDLTQRKRSDWVIRTSFTCSQLVYPLGTYSAKVLHHKKVVTIASDYQYGYEAVGGFQRIFEENGGKVIQKLWVPLDWKDDPTIIKAIKKDADAVFLVLAGKSSELFPAKYQEYGPKLPILAAVSTIDESVLPKAGEFLVGGISCSAWSRQLDSAANKRFASKYREKYGQDPTGFAEDGYVSAMWIDKAMQAVHGDVSNKEKLMQALRHVELTNAPRGPMKLDEYGNPIENVYIRRLDKTKDGLQMTILQTNRNISQFYKWKPESYLADPPYTRDYPPCTHCGTTP
jgi:branched-chain amino acid transport system substrate-binding protein